MIAEQLKKSILQAAIQGKLTQQLPEDGDARDLLKEIQKEKARLIKEGKIKKEKPLPEITEDEIPFEIPENWCWVRLGEVFSVSSGKNLKQTDMDKEGIYPVYGGNGINGKYHEYFVPKDTLVIGRVGFYCGCVHKTINKCWVTDNALIVEIKSNIYTLEFIRFILSFSDLKRTSVATAQPVISGMRIYPILVPLPPINEQKRIIERIEELLPEIESLKNDEARLEELQKSFPKKMKDAILQYAIQGKLTQQLPEDGDARDLLKEIQKEKARLIKEEKIKKEKPLPEITEDEIPFEIPENWCWVRLGEIVRLKSGQDMTPNNYNSINKGIPYITGASNFSDGTIIIDRWTEVPRSIAEKGDLLITCKGTVGEMAFLEETKAHIARQVMAIKGINSIKIEYIHLFLRWYVSELKSMAKSMIPGISREMIINALIPIPPIKEQQRIVEKLEEFLSEIRELENNDIKLK